MGSRLQTLLTGAAFVGGLAAFAVGVGLVFMPAGVMVAGALAVAASVLYHRGAGQ